LLLRYWRFANQHYRKDGHPTGTLNNIRYAAKPLKERYGHTRACDFGPLALKALRQYWIQSFICRNQVNQRTGIVRRIFKWGVSEELVPPAVLHGLQAVVGLREGRTEARETKPVEPVDDTAVEATLKHLPAVVADMVRIQRLVGCRPGEVCILRPCDVDTTGDVWVYRPSSHKTQHHGRERRIYVGPRAQDVLRPYLLRDKSSYCFSPRESEKKRRAARHARRVTPLSCGNRPGTYRKRDPMRTPKDYYAKDAYARSIARACDLAGVEHWAPNRLRHTSATTLRAQYGIEAAQTVLGHADPKITLTYAERDFALAQRIMREVG
jgi:integrase